MRSVFLSFFFLFPSFAFSSDYGAVKSAIDFQIATSLPSCFHVKTHPLPSEAKSFISRCGGSVTVSVRKKMYNLSVPVVTLMCSDFSGDNFSYSANIKGYASLVVIKSKHRVGSAIMTDDLDFKKISIDKIKSKPYCVKPTDYQYVYSRNVTSGILYEKYVRQNYSVRRGDSVIVHATVGNISIKTKATAAENCYKGNLCKLRNTGSTKMFSARVVGFNEVEVIK